ncbi:MAG: lytic transglycosylase domain-containing protein [Hydrogenophilaceae bacterium]|nr:lytic transglycosylase domain-containing protein [Hydrogenophilaceae bacterium]
MPPLASLFRRAAIAALLLAAAPATATDVIGDCGPPASAENPLYTQAQKAKAKLEASTAKAERKRQVTERWAPLQAAHIELQAEAERRDAECQTLKALADATLAEVRACQAQCDRAANSPSAYEACLACAGPANAELARREAEYVAFTAKENRYNARVLDWEAQLKRFSADAEAAIPKVIDKEVDRMAAILSDSPAQFVVADSNARPNPSPKHYFQYFEQVTKNANHIQTAAARHNVDPDLVRAVIWMESTRGYYDVLTGLIMKPKTILPMNVYADYWTGFKVTREGLKDPALNIDTGTKILARIQARLTDKSIAKIATLYGGLAAQQETEYGKTVEYYYQTKPWLGRPNK